MISNLNLDNYNYSLRNDRIAKYPKSKRDDSKLLVYKEGEFINQKFYNIDKNIPSNSSVFFNNSKVINARLIFKNRNNAKIEILVINLFNENYQNLLFNSLTQNFEDAMWLFNNQKIKGDNLSIIASNVSDEMFNLAPIIHNELVNRDRLSTNATQGSTSLISRIFNHADKENLGMEGHPAEFGLYLSVIKKHHLHKKTINGFEFSAPQKKEGKLFNFYETFNKIIKE